MKHLSEEQIAQYAEALASGKQEDLPEAILNHVKECDQCADEVMHVHEMLISEELKTQKPAGKKYTLKPVKWVSVAAGITLLVGLGGYLFLRTDQSIQPETADSQLSGNQSPKIVEIIEIEDVAKQKDTLKVPAESIKESADKASEDEVLLARFEPNKQLESLASRFGQEQMRSNDFRLQSDHYQKIQPKSHIEINWEAPEGELTFILRNNRDSLVLEKSAGKDGVRITEVSEPGLYYWKLMNSDFDLLYCGKIEIEKP
ncbi:MAG: hypothetical protein ACQESX_10705 [Bacteroidota bacterium]